MLGIRILTTLKQQLENVKNGTANLAKFVIKNGRKYYKIMQHDFDTFLDRNEL